MRELVQAARWKINESLLAYHFCYDVESILDQVGERSSLLLWRSVFS